MRGMLVFRVRTPGFERDCQVNSKHISSEKQEGRPAMAFFLVMSIYRDNLRQNKLASVWVRAWQIVLQLILKWSRLLFACNL